MIFDAFVCILNTKPHCIFLAIDYVLLYGEDNPKWINACNDKELITWHLCTYAQVIIERNMINVTRYFLRENYISPNWLVCATTKPMARLLIDFGAIRPPKKHLPIKQCKRAIRARQQLRQTTICILGAKRCRSRRIAGFADVLQIIARCMWSARLTESFWFQ
jgi:hypothetical protein